MILCYNKILLLMVFNMKNSDKMSLEFLFYFIIILMIGSFYFYITGIDNKSQKIMALAVKSGSTDTVYLALKYNQCLSALKNDNVCKNYLIIEASNVFMPKDVFISSLKRLNFENVDINEYDKNLNLALDRFKVKFKEIKSLCFNCKDDQLLLETGQSMTLDNLAIQRVGNILNINLKV